MFRMFFSTAQPSEQKSIAPKKPVKDEEDRPSLFKVLFTAFLFLSAGPLAVEARRAKDGGWPTFDSLNAQEKADTLAQLGNQENYNLCMEFAVVNGACGVVKMFNDHGNYRHLGEASDDCNTKPEVISRMKNRMTPAQRKNCANKIRYVNPRSGEELGFSTDTESNQANGGNAQAGAHQQPEFDRTVNRPGRRVR